MAWLALVTSKSRQIAAPQQANCSVQGSPHRSREAIGHEDDEDSLRASLGANIKWHLQVPRSFRQRSAFQTEWPL